MKIDLIQRTITEGRFCSYLCRMRVADFQAFGFVIEALEGLGSHHRYRADTVADVMAVDLPLDLEEDFLFMVSALNATERFDRIKKR